MRKAQLGDGYYDPYPKKLRYIHNPANTVAFPFQVIVLGVIGAALGILYTNTDNLDHLINAFDSEFKTLDAAEQEKHRQWYRTILAIGMLLVVLLCLYYLYEWRKQLKEAKMGYV